MTSREAVLGMDRRALGALLAPGHAIDPTRLDDTEYRGFALGLPKWVERLSWKTFQKVFHRDPASGGLRGWNVCIEQRGLDAASVAPIRRGAPFAWGHYDVVATAPDCRSPEQGLPIDYGGPNRGFGLRGRTRDPLVAVNSDSVELLLGWSYLELGVVRVPTPSFFLLQREGALQALAEAGTQHFFYRRALAEGGCGILQPPEPLPDRGRGGSKPPGTAPGPGSR